MGTGVREVLVRTVITTPGRAGSGDLATCFHRMSLWATWESGQSSPPRRPPEGELGGRRKEDSSFMEKIDAGDVAREANDVAGSDQLGRGGSGGWGETEQPSEELLYGELRFLGGEGNGKVGVRNAHALEVALRRGDADGVRRSAGSLEPEEEVFGGSREGRELPLAAERDPTVGTAVEGRAVGLEGIGGEGVLDRDTHRRGGGLEARWQGGVEEEVGAPGGFVVAGSSPGQGRGGLVVVGARWAEREDRVGRGGKRVRPWGVSRGARW